MPLRFGESLKNSPTELEKLHSELNEIIETSGLGHYVLDQRNTKFKKVCVYEPDPCYEREFKIEFKDSKIRFSFFALLNFF